MHDSCLVSFCQFSLPGAKGATTRASLARVAQELITLDGEATQKKKSVLKPSFSSLLNSIHSTMASLSKHVDPRSVSAGPQPMDTQAFSAAGGGRGIVSQMQIATPGIGARDSHSRHDDDDDDDDDDGDGDDGDGDDDDG